MGKKRLTAKEYNDEIVYRQIQVSRYATGQANYALSVIKELNEKIVKFCMKMELIETKSQYTECKKYIRSKSLIYRDKLYKYLRKELKAFIIEQSKWIYSNSPVELVKINIDRAYNDVFFSAFSDTDNIKTYVTRIFNQVLQLWNAQLSIAYRVNQPMKDMIKLIIGDGI